MGGSRTPGPFPTPLPRGTAAPAATAGQGPALPLPPASAGAVPPLPSGGSFFLSGQREANRGRSAGPQRLCTEYTQAGTALTKSPPAFAHPRGALWTMPGLPRRLPPSPAPLELPQPPLSPRRN